MTGIDIREMSHADWLAARNEGIGGSDAPAIMGASPWKTPLALYREKVGEAKPFEGNEATWIGTQLEEPVARRFAEETGLKVGRVNKIILNPNYPWMRGNIDRRIVGEKAGLEIKTTSPYNRTPFAEGVCPPVYIWQCLHYMVLTGWDTWYVAILHTYKSFNIFKLEAKDYQNEMASLIEAEREFWEEHVLKQNPPLPTGEDVDGEAISDMFPSADEGAYLDLSGYDDVLNLIRLKKQSIAETEKEVAALEQEIKLRMGSAERGITENWKVSWTNYTTSGIDSKRLRAEMPDIAAKYSKQSQSRRFSISEIKKED